MDTALILAGGESRRFGRPKALVDIAGKPMVRRVADVVIPLSEELVVSVANPKMEADLRPVVGEASFAVDRRPGRGPIEGVRCGFEVAHGDRVLVAPCDTPLLRPAMYRLLFESIGDHDAAVPKFEVIDPVRAVYRRRAVLEVLRGSEEVPSPSALVDHLDATLIDAARLRTADPDLVSFLEVNTRADLEEVLRRLSSARE